MSWFTIIILNKFKIKMYFSYLVKKFLGLHPFERLLLLYKINLVNDTIVSTQYTLSGKNIIDYIKNIFFCCRLQTYYF